MSTCTRREFMGQGAALAAAGLAAGTSVAAPERCNVVVLISDEHNPKYSSVHGHPFVETPSMRRMAERGTVFENGYCPSPLCAPSRCSFLSGLRVHQHRYYSNCTVFREKHETYAEVLGRAGVHTVHVGKADYFRPVAECGFAEVLRGGDRAQPGDIAIRRHPLEIRSGEGARRAKAWGPVEQNPWKHDEEPIHDALNWLRTKAPGLGKPFTLVANILTPHFPLYVTREAWERHAKHGDLPKFGKEQASAQHPYAEDLRRHFETDAINEEQTRGLRRGYLGCVDRTDEVIGQFIDTLDASGLAKNTVFIYTSDHGEMLGKFGMWWKCSLYEDSGRVPVLAMGPGIGAGKRVKTPVDLHDVNATLFRTAGVPRPKHWCGTALQDIVENDKERVLFTEYHGHGTRASSYMVRQGPWKLIWYAEAPHQLFNLDEDPEELKNLSNAAPDKFRKIESILLDICDPVAENKKAEGRITRQLAAL